MQTDVASLPFEPLPAFQAGPLQNEAESAKCNGKRIGILIVTYNAVTTLTKVLKRITPEVWAMWRRSPFSTTPVRTPPMN